MKKDWVIWVGCISLFCTGAIWGMIPIKTGFFVVDNVHDLFEIFSSAATVAAVFLAFIGVNAWRQQLSAQSDHALAQRVAIAALKYKEVSRSAYNDAHFAVTQFRYGLDSVPEGILDRFIINMEGRLQKGQDSKAEFLAVLLESRAIWGLEFSSKYDELIGITEGFYGCVRMFFKWARLDPNDELAEAYEASLQKHYDYFDEQGWLLLSAAQVPKFDELTQSADEDLREKLLKSS